MLTGHDQVTRMNDDEAANNGLEVDTKIVAVNHGPDDIY